MTRDEQLAYFQEHGYLAVEDVFSLDEIDRLRTSLAELEHRARGISESTDRIKLTLFGGGGEDPAIQQIADPHEIDGEWMDLAADPRILDLVEAVIGPNIQLYYSMLMMKPARSGAPAPWHQDLAFFVHDRARLVACQVYLDDSTVENGCIHVVPGSHRHGLLNHFDGRPVHRDRPGRHVRIRRRRRARPGPAGGIVLWHCLTLHRSRRTGPTGPAAPWSSSTRIPMPDCCRVHLPRARSAPSAEWCVGGTLAGNCSRRSESTDEYDSASGGRQDTSAS